MIRERCSCGAEFETDRDDALKLLREWRNKHRHDVTLERRDVELNAMAEVAAAPYVPELHVGFRADPFDE